MANNDFVAWTAEQLDLTPDEVEEMRLAPTFDLFISRIEEARARGAKAPLMTITAKQAGGNSRATTRRMLDHLRFDPQQRRAMHRLMAGSPSGWPGLLLLYAEQTELVGTQRKYARRQVRAILARHPDLRRAS